jgi:hypothetical protein
MADPTASHARKRLGGGACTGGGGVAGDGLTSAPGHENAWGKLLRAAGDLANLTMRLHG